MCLQLTSGSCTNTGVFNNVQVLFVNTDNTMGCRTPELYLQLFTHVLHNSLCHILQINNNKC
jgi:hypothetical protein